MLEKKLLNIKALLIFKYNCSLNIGSVNLILKKSRF